MNKIVLALGKIKEANIDDCLSVKIEDKKSLMGVTTLKINIVKDTSLEISYDTKEEIKYDVSIKLEKGVCAKIYEFKTDGIYKISYKYDLEKESNLEIYKVNDVSTIKESVIINLNDDKAKVNYLFKTISKDQEKYDLMIYHKASSTISNIINNGVSINDGQIIFNVSGFVPKGIKGCYVNQDNRIINLNNSKNQIMPNLFIDENDVVANHSAHIGKCNDEEMFYLMSRGITMMDAENLIIKGFLTKGLGNHKEIMMNMIDKYWD